MPFENGVVLLRYEIKKWRLTICWIDDAGVAVEDLAPGIGRVFAPMAPFVEYQRAGKGGAMTAPSWPPVDHYPIADWTDDELIDQYRWVKVEFAGDESDYLDTDDNVAVLLQEIIRRGLDGLAEAVEDDPATAGRETV